MTENQSPKSRVRVAPALISASDTATQALQRPGAWGRSPRGRALSSLCTSLFQAQLGSLLGSFPPQRPVKRHHKDPRGIFCFLPPSRTEAEREPDWQPGVRARLDNGVFRVTRHSGAGVPWPCRDRSAHTLPSPTVCG